MKERVFFEEFDSLYYFHGNSQNWKMQGFHFHNQYEILLFLTDGAVCEVGSRIYHVKAGDLILINNKEYHRTSAGENQRYNRYVLMFEPALLTRTSQALHYDFSRFFEDRGEDFNHKIHLEGENRKRIEKRFGEIERNISAKKSRESKLKIELSILELIVEINELYAFFMERKKDAVENGDQEERFQDPVLYRERIEEIKKYISGHVEEKLDLDDIAQRFYLSRYYLSRYFKKETGFTLKEYVTNQKIISAKSMLRRGLTVTDVSSRLCYNSDSHFISVFKKATGITPKKYAQSHREEASDINH